MRPGKAAPFRRDAESARAHGPAGPGRRTRRAHRHPAPCGSAKLSEGPLHQRRDIGVASESRPHGDHRLARGDCGQVRRSRDSFHASFPPAARSSAPGHARRSAGWRFPPKPPSPAPRPRAARPVRPWRRAASCRAIPPPPARARKSLCGRRAAAARAARGTSPAPPAKARWRGRFRKVRAGCRWRRPPACPRGRSWAAAPAPLWAR